MTKNHIIIGLSLLAVGFILALLFRPVPKPQILGSLTESQENELKASLVTLEGQNDSLRSELGKSKADGKVAQEAFNREIKTKVKTISELKSRPVVVKLVEATPALDSLHKAYDSAMVAYEDRIFSLTNELQQRDRITGRLVANFEQRLLDTNQLLQEKELENKELTKANKKLKTGRVLRNVLIPVAAAGAFMLGLIVGD